MESDPPHIGFCTKSHRRSLIGVSSIGHMSNLVSFFVLFLILHFW